MMRADSQDLGSTIALSESQKELRLAEVLDAYMRELEAGGIPPDIEAWIASHPDLAGELREYAESLQMIHRMTVAVRPPKEDQGAGDATAVRTPPKRLGDFEILRELGRGGMGIVFEARQISLNRRVALKILPLAAMLDDRQIARFRNEAQAAAQLHHPHIVSVYAVGQERGVNFIAMQYIDGQSLGRAIEDLRELGANGTSPTAETRDQAAVSSSRGARRAETETKHDRGASTLESIRTRNHCRTAARLVLEAADALHHAHECGIIHRDVKPSNLLLDCAGKLWITDFGLARIDASPGVTLTGDVLGTLRYMSPEQAAGRTAQVDGRTDVYALGATLYELLTLQPLHAGEDRPEILRRIEHVDPASPRTVNRSTPYDLETIVLRAVAKSRDDRYATAGELADDLRRYLAGQRPLARRPTLADRASRWLQRRWQAAALAVATLMIITLITAAAATRVAIEKARTDEALKASERHLIRAQQHFREARDVVDRFGGGLARELAELPGSEPIRQRLLTEALKYYRTFIDVGQGDKDLADQLAATCFKAAMVAESLGQRDEALELCKESLARYDRLAAETPDSRDLTLDRAKCRGAFATLLAETGDSQGALAAHRQTVLELRRMAADPLEDDELARELAQAYGNLGLLQAQLGKSAQAHAALVSAIEALDATTVRHGGRDNIRTLAVCYNNLSYVERPTDLKAAEVACRRAIELLEPLTTHGKPSLALRTDQALCYSNLGSLAAARGEWQAAADAHRQAIDLQREMVRQSPTVVSHRRDLAASYCNLGQACDGAGSAVDALAAFGAAEHIAAELVEEFPKLGSLRSLHGAVLNNRGMALESLGQTAGAVDAFRSAADEQKHALDQFPASADYRERLSKHYFNLGRTLRKAGRADEAAEVALVRRDLWAKDGAHLGQVAVELAEAVAQLANEKSAAKRDAADRLRPEIAVTLRAAAAAGCDVDALPIGKELVESAPSGGGEATLLAPPAS